MLMVVAPAWTATATIFTRKSGSVRVASSAENSTSSVKVRARRTDSAAWSRASARVIFSLASRWRLEEAREGWLRDLADGVGVALAGDGEAGLDDIDAEVCQLVGHAQLFVVVHGAAGGLFAVAE